jgi:DNA-binding transcriptional regulator YhcF (GntR family)
MQAYQYQTQKAIDFIRDRIKDESLSQSNSIPSSRLIAAEIHVSQATVVKAIALLKKEGLIHSIPRCRIKINPESSIPFTALKKVENPWSRVRKRLEQDIESGVFSNSASLPSVKELQSKYGVCFRTMRRALDSLAADKILTLERKQWQLRIAAHDAARSVIRFITHRGFAMQRSAINQEQNLVANLFERECASRGLQFEILEVDFYDSADVRRIMALIKSEKPPLGFVFDIWWYTTPEFRALHVNLLDRIAASNSPIAIIDELGDFELPVAFRSYPRIQVFRIEGVSAGERMAGYLFGLGHHRAVYISLSHFFSWSRRRLEGLSARFERAGYPDAVIPVVSTSVDVILLYVMEAAGLDDATIRAVLAVGRTKRQAEDQYGAIVRFRTENPLHKINPDAAAILRNDLASLADLAKKQVSLEFFHAQVQSAILASENSASRIILCPLFDQAFACADATAWVCASDGIALAALKFLAQKGIEVPDQISVSGFDNNPVLGLENGLTSYDFNATVFVHRMLNFLARPHKPRGQYRHSVIEIEGIVIERGTTGKR